MSTDRTLIIKPGHTLEFAEGSSVVTESNVGVSASGVTAAEGGNGTEQRTVLTLATTLPAIAGGASLGVGSLIYTFPDGEIVIKRSFMSVAITQTEGNITADQPDVGLGTVIAVGVIAVLSGTATFENVITGQTATDSNGTTTVKTAIPTANVPLVIAAADAHTLHFNAAAAWTASGDAAPLLTGTVIIDWSFMA